MKRTGEITLGIIGAVFYGIMAGFGALMVWLQGNRQFLEDSMNEAAEQDPSLAAGDLDMVVDALGAGGNTLLTTGIIALVLGIIAIILTKGNKKPKLAGIIFIIVAVIIAFTSFGVGIFAGIFYLIAGIMCLARKPKEIIE